MFSFISNNKYLILIICVLLVSCGDSSMEPDKPSTGTLPTPIVLKIPTEGFQSETSYIGMSQIWADEFTDAELDETKWNFQTGNGSNGWGNNELQNYKKENVQLKDGFLVIEAKQEGLGYTSSRINTLDKFSFKYGRVDVRAALPEGQGIWPAIWMLGDNIETIGWPKCGEIDIMEMIGGSGRENTIHGTVHWDNAGSRANYGGSTTLSSGTFADEFHVFSIAWDSEKITWYLDNEEFHIIDTTPSGLSELNESFHFLMNVAIGGNWPENPDATTNFSQFLIVDYIRVFQLD